MELYFRDRFFSRGVTEIMDETGAAMGQLDLESSLTSSVSVYGPDAILRYAGSFRFFSSKWEVRDAAGTELGVLRYRLSFFSKRYEYDAGYRGVYEIEAEPFSKHYTVRDESGSEVASFEKISGWLEAGAFRLRNYSDRLDSYELVAVIMGVNGIHRQQSS
ncbi:hypothetical protein NQZ67_22040 [Paenibacillus sp. SCIV0701]|uniref:Uncharacterized protein n=2 Tax=Paenibacillus soyae TaxID=2969249 RepID=A0A9X2MUJ3_9BACL|nr:hypothetical protein [Paenibacillus soyae]